MIRLTTDTAPYLDGIDRDPSDGPLIDALEAAVDTWREATQ